MIDLYTASTPNGWKVSITLEELNIPYKIIPIDLIKGEQKESSFLKINSVPLISSLKLGF